MKPGRVYDRLERAQPHNPFRGKSGTVLLLRLGLAAQFRKVVPSPEHALGPWVACVCGQLLDLDLGEIRECPGGCDRWFLRLEESVRVARWPREEGPN